MPNEKLKCCLCGEEFGGCGNNPAPLAEEGRCCDKCNEKVVSARFAAALEARLGPRGEKPAPSRA